MRNIVYVVMCNSDMTEGKGPMVMHSVWSNWIEAARFVDRQLGVMGRQFKWSSTKHGDWEIKKMNLMHNHECMLKSQNEALRKQALSKLTPEERKALNL